MTFEELWEIVWNEAKLPNEAKTFLPQSLTEKTKNKLIEIGLSSTEIAEIIETAIDQINHGSTETIDKLVMKAVTNSIKKGK